MAFHSCLLYTSGSGHEALYHFLLHIIRVITAIGEWSPPALVGLCEVENDTVLRDLTRRSPLKELSYRYVMTNSPDLRGIDVALLYQRDLFKLLSSRSISIPP